jgi:hypothetical protein
MDAVSATIVAGGRAQFQYNKRSIKQIIFYFNLLNLLNCFDGGVGKMMRKAARPSSGMDSSNPRRWRGERLHHHDHCDGVCLLFVLFVLSCLVVVTRRM